MGLNKPCVMTLQIKNMSWHISNFMRLEIDIDTRFTCTDTLSHLPTINVTFLNIHWLDMGKKQNKKLLHVGDGKSPMSYGMVGWFDKDRIKNNNVNPECHCLIGIYWNNTNKAYSISNIINIYIYSSVHVHWNNIPIIVILHHIISIIYPQQSPPNKIEK